MISRSGPSARLAALAFATVLSCGTALAQGSAATAPAPPAATQAAAADPVVARVNGQAIHLSDVKAAAAGLPANVRSLPPDQLYPKLLDSMVSAQALADAARKAGIDKDPAVQRQMESAANQVLDNALLSKVVLPAITEQALQARYQQEIAGKPGAEEVHARHILVDSEAQAKEIIAELNKGADFGALAKKYSKDPGAADGGDLGFFKRDEMVPAFSDAAFALKPGQYTQTPVHTQFGWHVILVEARRQAPAPTFEQARDQLRQEMLKESIQQQITKARAAADVQVFNLDGSPMRVTDTAVPPKAKQ